MEVRVISVPRPLGKILLALTRPLDRGAKKPAREEPADTVEATFEDEEEPPVR